MGQSSITKEFRCLDGWGITRSEIVIQVVLQGLGRILSTPGAGQGSLVLEVGSSLHVEVEFQPEDIQSKGN